MLIYKFIRQTSGKNKKKKFIVQISKFDIIIKDINENIIS